MVLAIHFTTNDTLDQYNEIWRQLDAADLDDPKGRLYHVSWGADGAVGVLDVWESPADFEAFGGTLMPIATGLGEG
jgi:hypothetical protein